MDVQNSLTQLREELAGVNESITALEILASGRRRGPGRPPKWAEVAEIRKRRGRPPGNGKAKEK
jgi:hypothetical protein